MVPFTVEAPPNVVTRTSVTFQTPLVKPGAGGVWVIVPCQVVVPTSPEGTCADAIPAEPIRQAAARSAMRACRAREKGDRDVSHAYDAPFYSGTNLRSVPALQGTTLPDLVLVETAIVTVFVSALLSG